MNSKVLFSWVRRPRENCHDITHMLIDFYCNKHNENCEGQQYMSNIYYIVEFFLAPFIRQGVVLV